MSKQLNLVASPSSDFQHLPTSLGSHPYQHPEASHEGSTPGYRPLQDPRPLHAQSRCKPPTVTKVSTGAVRRTVEKLFNFPEPRCPHNPQGQGGPLRATGSPWVLSRWPRDHGCPQPQRSGRPPCLTQHSDYRCPTTGLSSTCPPTPASCGGHDGRNAVPCSVSAWRLQLLGRGDAGKRNILEPLGLVSATGRAAGPLSHTGWVPATAPSLAAQQPRAGSPGAPRPPQLARRWWLPFLTSASRGPRQGVSD